MRSLRPDCPTVRPISPTPELSTILELPSPILTPIPAPSPTKDLKPPIGSWLLTIHHLQNLKRSRRRRKIRRIRKGSRSTLTQTWIIRDLATLWVQDLEHLRCPRRVQEELNHLELPTAPPNIRLSQTVGNNGGIMRTGVVGIEPRKEQTPGQSHQKAGSVPGRDVVGTVF